MRNLVLAVAVLASSLAVAGAKSYQVTGKVLDVKGDVVVVEKGKEKWEINLASVKPEGGELKVGGKVTIEYTMTATSVTVKDKK